MTNKSNIKVDSKNRCIDRSTNLGKAFEQLNESIEAYDDEKEKAFMSEISAYVETAMIVENTLPADKSQKAIAKLRTQMQREIDS